MSYRMSDYISTCHIQLGSINYAMRAQKLLQQKGYATSTVKAPTQTQHGGCLYGLAIPCVQREGAVRVLREHGMRIIE